MQHLNTVSQTPTMALPQVAAITTRKLGVDLCRCRRGGQEGGGVGVWARQPGSPAAALTDTWQQPPDTCISAPRPLDLIAHLLPPLAPPRSITFISTSPEPKPGSSGSASGDASVSGSSAGGGRAGVLLAAHGRGAPALADWPVVRGEGWSALQLQKPDAVLHVRSAEEHRVRGGGRPSRAGAWGCDRRLVWGAGLQGHSHAVAPAHAWPPLAFELTMAPGPANVGAPPSQTTAALPRDFALLHSEAGLNSFMAVVGGREGCGG
jgi:hypothetical protein